MNRASKLIIYGLLIVGIAIANLKIRTADLLAAKAELERQQEEEKLKIEDEVLNLLLDYELPNVNTNYQHQA